MREELINQQTKCVCVQRERETKINPFRTLVLGISVREYVVNYRGVLQYESVKFCRCAAIVYLLYTDAPS